MAKTPDKISELFSLLPSGFFKDEDELRGFVQDEKSLKEVYSFLPQEYFSDEDEYASYFGDAVKKKISLTGSLAEGKGFLESLGVGVGEPSTEPSTLQPQPQKKKVESVSYEQTNPKSLSLLAQTEADRNRISYTEAKLQELSKSTEDRVKREQEALLKKYQAQVDADPEQAEILRRQFEEEAINLAELRAAEFSKAASEMLDKKEYKYLGNNAASLSKSFQEIIEGAGNTEAKDRQIEELTQSVLSSVPEETREAVRGEINGVIMDVAGDSDIGSMYLMQKTAQDKKQKIDTTLQSLVAKFNAKYPNIRMQQAGAWPDDALEMSRQIELLSQASNTLDKVLQVPTAKKGSGVAAWREAVPSILTVGMAGFVESTNLGYLINKQAKGATTEEEDAIIDAAGTLEAMKGMASEQFNAYRRNQSIAGSVEYIEQFLLTAGQGAIAKKVGASVGKKVVESKLKNAFVKGAIKRVTVPVIEGAVSAGLRTPLAPMTYKSIAEATMGDFKVDNGQFVVDEETRPSMIKAIVEGTAQSGIDIFSESLGGIVDIPSKWLNRALTPTARKAFQTIQLNGLQGEFFEEIAAAVMQGDAVDKEFLTDLMVTVPAMVGGIGVIAAPSTIANANSRAKRKDLIDTFGRDKLTAIRDAIQDKNEDALVSIVNEAGIGLVEGGMTPEQAKRKVANLVEYASLYVAQTTKDEVSAAVESKVEESVGAMPQELRARPEAVQGELRFEPEVEAKEGTTEFVGTQKDENNAPLFDLWNVFIDGKPYTFSVPVGAEQSVIDAKRDSKIAEVTEGKKQPVEPVSPPSGTQIPPTGESAVETQPRAATGISEPVQYGRVTIPLEGRKKSKSIGDNTDTEVSKIYVGGEYRGKAEIASEQGVAQIRWINVNKKEGETGNGKNAYRTLRDQARERGEELISDIYYRQSADAKNAWESLVKSGEAVKVGNYYMFADAPNKEQLVATADKLETLRSSKGVPQARLIEGREGEVFDDLVNLSKEEFYEKYKGEKDVKKLWRDARTLNEFINTLSKLNLNSEEGLQLLRESITFAKDNNLTEKYGDISEVVGTLESEVRRREARASGQAEQDTGGGETEADRGRGQVGRGTTDKTLTGEQVVEADSNRIVDDKLSLPLKSTYNENSGEIVLGQDVIDDIRLIENGAKSMDKDAFGNLWLETTSRLWDAEGKKNKGKYRVFEAYFRSLIPEDELFSSRVIRESLNGTFAKRRIITTPNITIKAHNAEVADRIDDKGRKILDDIVAFVSETMPDKKLDISIGEQPISVAGSDGFRMTIPNVDAPISDMFPYDFKLVIPVYEALEKQGVDRRTLWAAHDFFHEMSHTEGIDVEKEADAYAVKKVQEFTSWRASKTTETTPTTTEGEIVPPEKATQATEGKEEGRKRSGFEERSVERRVEDQKDEVGKAVKEIVDSHPHFYDEMHQKDAIVAAQEFINEKGGFEAAYDALVGKTTNMEEFPLRQVARQIVMQHYGQVLVDSIRINDKQTAQRAANKIENMESILQKEATIGGQASAMIMWKMLPAEATVFFINKHIDEANAEKLGFQAKEAKEFVDEYQDNASEIVTKLLKENDSLRDYIDKLEKRGYGKGRGGTAKIPMKKAKDVAAKIRARKLSNLGLTFADPTGLSAIIDGGLELTASIIEATGNVLHAINRGLALIRSSQLYKSLGKAKQKEIDNSFRERVREDAEFELAPEDIKTDQELRDQIFDVIRAHYLVKNKDKSKLIDALIEDIGLTKKEAQGIVDIALEHFTEAAGKIFERTLAKKIAKPKTKSSVFKKFMELIMDGVLFDDIYADAFSEKFGLKKNLSPDERARLMTLAHNANQLSPYGYFGDLAVGAMMQYVDTLVPKDNFLIRQTRLMIAVNYARMLSGYTTHYVNLLSAGANLILRPLGQAVNLSAWSKALNQLRKNGKTGFQLSNPLADAMYAWQGYMQGARAGIVEARNIVKNGDVRGASKYVEERARKITTIPELERDVFGRGKRFKPITLTVGGRKIDINPWNYAKFSGRTLLAEDALMLNTSFTLELMLATRRKLLQETNLRGKELRQEVIRQVQGEYLSKQQRQAVEDQLEAETNALRAAGIEPDPAQITQRRTQLVREAIGLSTETMEEIEQSARGEIFTDQRGGIFTMMADAMSHLVNKNLTVKFLTMTKIPFTMVLGRIADMTLDTMYGGVRARGWSPTGIIARARAATRTGSFNDFWKSPQSMGLFSSAQLGERGSIRYEQQMRRQYLGMMTMAILYPIVMGSGDDDDFIDITGGLHYADYDKKQQHPMGAYVIRIGNVKIKYLAIPILNGMLGILGNYKDAVRAGVDEEEISAKLQLSLLSLYRTLGMIKDSSLAQGIAELFELLTGVMNVIGEKTDKAQVRDGVIDVEMPPQVTKQLEGMVADYMDIVGKYVSPLRSNMIQQIWKSVTPESRLKGTTAQVLSYNLGLQNLTNDIKTDIFGEVVSFMPGETNIAWPRDDNTRWAKMWQYNINLEDIKPYELRTVKGERRTLEYDEWQSRKKLSNELFRDEFDKYFKERPAEYIAKRAEEKVVVPSGRNRNVINGVQEDMAGIWSDVKESVHKYLFVWDEFTEGNKELMTTLMKDMMLPNYATSGDITVAVDKKQISLTAEQLAEYNKIAMTYYITSVKAYMSKTERVGRDKKAVVDETTGLTRYERTIDGYWSDAREGATEDMEKKIKGEVGKK